MGTSADLSTKLHKVLCDSNLTMINPINELTEADGRFFTQIRIDDTVNLILLCKNLQKEFPGLELTVNKEVYNFTIPKKFDSLIPRPSIKDVFFNQAVNNIVGLLVGLLFAVLWLVYKDGINGVFNFPGDITGKV